MDAIRAFLSSAALALALASSPASGQSGAHAGHHPVEGDVSMLGTPQSIAAEHAELHEVLAGAAREPGRLGETARALEEALAPHFRREEEVATPPLGLLAAIAAGEPVDRMVDVLPMTDTLERELPQMLREHGAIREALAAFRAAAQQAGRGDYVEFAEDLAAHARQEEEILYPAAILVGRYVRAMTAGR